MVNRFLVLLLILSFFCLSGCGRLLQPRSAVEIQDSSADVDGKYLGYLEDRDFSNPRSILRALSLMRETKTDTSEKTLVQIRRVDDGKVEISIEKEGKTRLERCSFEIIENEMYMRYCFCAPYFPFWYGFIRIHVGLSKNTKNNLIIRSDGVGIGGIFLIVAGGGFPRHPAVSLSPMSEVPK